MAQVGTMYKVVDNSGAKWVKCIRVLGKGNKKVARVSGVILVTIVKFQNRKKVKKSLIYLGLVLSVSKWIFRSDGTFIKFYSNRVLLFNKQFKFLGTRVYGIMPKEMRHQVTLPKKERKHYQRVLSYSRLVV